MTRRLWNKAIFNIDICPLKLLSLRILFKGSVIVNSVNKTLIINRKTFFVNPNWGLGGGGGG